MLALWNQMALSCISGSVRYAVSLDESHNHRKVEEVRRHLLQEGIQKWCSSFSQLHSTQAMSKTKEFHGFQLHLSCDLGEARILRI